MANLIINTEATLKRFSVAEIRVVAWCRDRDINRRYFYFVINNKIGKTRAAINAQKIKKELKKSGLLVMARGKKE